jgi:hypothetical protein
MREGSTSRVTAADRPYGEFYDFYSVSPENFGSTLVYSNCLLMTNSYSIRKILRIDCSNKLRKKSASCCSLSSKYAIYTCAGVQKACFMINVEGFFPWGKTTGACIWLQAFIQFLYLAPTPSVHDAQLKTGTNLSFNQTQVRFITLTHHNRLCI